MTVIIPTYPAGVYVFAAKIVVVVLLVLGFVYGIRKVIGASRQQKPPLDRL